MGCNQSSTIDTKNASMFDEITLGDQKIANRFVMGPMTRCRADPKTNIPTEIMVKYYQQRAGFGLILSECAPISPLSNAFPGAGGIYTEEQTQAWKKVVDAVHAKGSKIVLQIWHCGRATASEFIDNKVPLAPSALAIQHDHSMLKKPHPVPKEMTQQDINEVIEQFRKGAENAKKAGFDGVQLHGANGYLIDQFLRDGSNKRTDKYGGSIENRSRFLFEALDALISVYGSQRVSVRIGLTGRYNDMYDSDPYAIYKYLLPKLSELNLQFVEIKRHGGVDIVKVQEGSDKDDQGRIIASKQVPGDYFATLRPLYKGILIANDGFNPQTALETIRAGHADLVSFSQLSIINPDLPQRVQNNWPLNKEQDYSTFFMGGEKGYCDIPAYKA